MASSSGSGGGNPRGPRPGQPAPWQPPAPASTPAQPTGWAQPPQGQQPPPWQQPGTAWPQGGAPNQDPAAPAPSGDDKYNTVFLVAQLQQQRRRALLIGTAIAVAIMIAMALFLQREMSKPPVVPKPSMGGAPNAATTASLISAWQRCCRSTAIALADNA